MPSNIKRLGSRERGMVVIPPTEGPAVDALRQLDQIVSDRSMKAKMDKWIKGRKDDSVRLIQGGRIEIFLSATGKTTTFFDTVLGAFLPPDSKTQILEYAQKKAREDPRLQGNTRFTFNEFSLICSHGMVDAQSPHIDCIHPNFQFGLAVSDGCTGTMFFEPQPNNRIENTDAMIEHWRRMAAVSDDNDSQNTALTPALVNAIKQDEVVDFLLEGFGDVLLPARHMLYNMQKETNLPTGALLSLPGGVVHAAPATARYRSVIFFTGCPKDDPSNAYNPDTQYSGVMLAAQIVSILWTKAGVGYQERLFLLHRLVQYIEGSTVRNIWKHFDEGPLADFIGNIEQGSYKKQRLSKEDYIRTVGKEPFIWSQKDPYFEGCGAAKLQGVVNLQGFELVSEPNLQTPWDDGNYDVEVYRRRADGKVILRYPSTKSGHQDEFEGNAPDEKFRLVMRSGAEESLFDGSNGILLDSEGKKVEIYRGK